MADWRRECEMEIKVEDEKKGKDKKKGLTRLERAMNVSRKKKVEIESRKREYGKREKKE